jgi:hypothetical protein
MPSVATWKTACHSPQKAEESGYRDLENVYTLANHLRDHMDDELIYLPGIE